MKITTAVQKLNKKTKTETANTFIQLKVKPSLREYIGFIRDDNDLKNWRRTVEKAFRYIGENYNDFQKYIKR